MSEEIKQSVQRQFGEVAANYAQSALHAHGQDLAIMVKSANLTGDERILDAGCGAGHTALAFAPHVARVVAYDLTPAMLTQVERLAIDQGYGNISSREGDVEQIVFEDDAFDRVVTRFSAHHWPRPLQALHEFVRVLKPGGLFILSDVVAPDDLTLDTFLQAIELLRDISHVRDHSIAQWTAMLTEAEFDKVEVVYTWDLHLEFRAWVERIRTPELNMTMIKALFDSAPQYVRAALHLQPDYSFSIPCAVIRGRAPA